VYQWFFSLMIFTITEPIYWATWKRRRFWYSKTERTTSVQIPELGTKMIISFMKDLCLTWMHFMER
jgi:hypothetical protein